MRDRKKSEEIAIAAGQSLKERNYWLNKLSGELTRCNFPYDYDPKGATEYEGHSSHVEIELSSKIFQQLIKLSKNSDYTLFIVLVSGLVLLLGKYTAEDDIIIGAPIDRQQQEGEFINTVLVLRNQLKDNMSFKELLLQVKQTIVEACENQNYPLETLLYDLNMDTKQSEFPLFDISVLLENIHEKSYIDYLNTNIRVHFLRTDEKLEMTVEFNPLLYRKTSIKKTVNHFADLLEMAVSNIDLEIDHFSLLSEEKKTQLLFDFNRTDADYPKNKTSPSLFQEQVEKAPGQTALVFEDHQLTYGQLNKKANRLAMVLRNKNVKPETVVGVMVERSIGMLIALLGVLKAGGAYLPIDPQYPLERIHFMMEDSDIHLLLSQNHLADRISFAGEILHCDNPCLYHHDDLSLELINKPHHAAYIIYTSGSTGEPKGVVVEHGAILNTLLWRKDYYNFNQQDAVLQIPSFSFDSSVEDIFTPLISGSVLVIIPKDQRFNLEYLKEVITKKRVTHFLIIPSFYKTFLKEIPVSLKKVRAVTLAGEGFAGEMVEEHFKRLENVELYNEYGPTENSVCSTVYKFSPGHTQVLIGKPINNVTCYILNKKGKLNPIGIPGELCLSGVGLARYYLNRPRLTEEKFVPNPYLLGKKMYKTGDLAKWIPDGNIEFLGRIDHQVKIRGFRIELEEIENQLRMHPAIKEAIVIVRDTLGESNPDNQGVDRYLCAYLVIEGELTAEALREFLLLRLPDYMIPVHYIRLNQMPKTLTGKIDRNALPQLDENLKMRTDFAAPRNPIEQKMVEIWSHVLHLEKVGIKDNFFTIGGDSIRIINLLNEINREFNTDFKVVDLYQNNTIEQLVENLHIAATTSINQFRRKFWQQVEELKDRIIKEHPLAEDIEDIYPLSDIEKGMIFHYLKDPSSHVYLNQTVFQIRLVGFDEKRFKRAVGLMAEKHPIFRTVYNMHDFEEPVHIVYKNIPLDIRYFYISPMERSQKEERIHSDLEKMQEEPFDFSGKKPLWNMIIFDLGSDNIRFIWNCHHAMIDGWSFASFMTELYNTYLTLKSNPSFVPELLKNTYKEFVIQQITEKEKPEVIEFWQRELADYKRLEFPGSLTNAPPSAELKWHYNYLGTSLFTQLNEAAERYDTSVKHLCFGTFLYMLNMVSYENDIVVGLVTNNRPVCKDGEKIIGCFLNTVPVRMKIPAKITCLNYIDQLEQKLVELKKYDNLSLFEIKKILDEKNQDNSPIFEAAFNFTDFYVMGKMQEDSEGVEEQRNAESGLSIQNDEGGLVLNTGFNMHIEITARRFRYFLSYSNSVLCDELALKLCDYFERILNKFITDPEQMIRKYDMIPPAEKQKLLYDLNGKRLSAATSKTLHQLFEEQVERTPKQIVLHTNLTFSDIYEELKKKYESNESLLGKFEQCCFKVNPYIFQYEDRGILKLITGSDKKELEELVLLRTHRENLIGVNPPLLSLLEYFNGKNNLKSIYEGLVNQDTRFFLFNIMGSTNTGPLRYRVETYEIKKSSFATLIPLVKDLYNACLIDLTDYESQHLPLYIRLNDSDAYSAETPSPYTVVTNETTKPTVLLLGDTTGVGSNGLLYLASFLRRHGIAAFCQWNDTNITTAQLKDNIKTLLSRVQPQLVGISMKWFPHIARVYEMCKCVKESNPLIKVIVGGNTAAYYSEKVISNKWVDVVVIGDGEIPLLNLCQGKDESEIPNCAYKKDGKIVRNSISYVQDEKNSSDIYLSHLDEIFVFPVDPYLAPYFYINTGKGCSQQCFYCAGCLEVQKQSFNRAKPFIRGLEEVRKDIRAVMKYTSTLMFDFDLPMYNSYSYYEQLWKDIDLHRHFCHFYFWKLPSSDFVDLVAQTFKYVCLNIDLCSLSQDHRLTLSALGVVKPQPTDDALFSFFDYCTKYENIEIKINQIAGLPYFSSEDINKADAVLSRIIRDYSNFVGIDWGRLHAQPGAPITTNSEKYNMHSYAKTYKEFLHYSHLNLEEKDYPLLKTLHYPYIYFNDDDFNSKISQFYFETEKKLETIRDTNREKLIIPTDITYKELNEKANQLARKLRTIGINEGTIIGIMVKPSIEMIVGILGILKAGGAYLPLDPSYPLERLNYMLDNSGAGLLIHDSSMPMELPMEQLIDINDQSIYSGTSSNLDNDNGRRLPNHAYVIYTSGTTGQPKGVLIRHRNIVNTLLYRKEEYKMTDKDVSLQLFSHSFDGFLTSFFTPVVSGARVVLLGDQEVKDIFRIINAILKNKVTHFICVPPLYQAIIESLSETDAAYLKVITLAGDKVNPTLMEFSKQKNSNIEVVNEYGVTEAAVMSTIYRHQEKDSEVKIGKPINNTSIYILDKQDHLQPIGVVGELCIGGAGLAAGYINNSQLTVERFIPHPQQNKEIIYKSGDLARWLPDGNIQLLGRIDHQVKLRGFRIETAEIETQLMSHPWIKEAVVICREDERGNNHLYSYMVGSDGTQKIPDSTNLREYLSQKLPDYMIPSYFVPLERIPLTPTGKIDLRALLSLEIKTGKEYVKPRNEEEKKLASIWSEILGIENEIIGITDNFFELGGNSLNLIMLISKIYNEFGVKISINQIYLNPIIREVSRAVASKTYIEEPVILLNQLTARKIFCFPSSIGFGVNYTGIASILKDYSFYSFNFIESDDRLTKYVDIIKNIQPVEPYIFFGWSAAGGIIFKVAKLLENHGYRVSDVIFADCFWTDIEKRERLGIEAESRKTYFKEIEEYLERMNASFLKERVLEKTKKYITFFENLARIDIINANVHLILSEQKKEPDLLKCWDKYTTKTITIYQGFGEHRNMFEASNLEKNTKIIERILDQIEFPDV